MAFISSITVQIIAAIILASSATAQISSGYATYSNGNGGVCSGSGSSLPSVAMNAAQFANGAACGQCIQITANGNGAGTDPVSTSPYIATINNVCPQCAYGDIDLQESGNGKYGISWTFVPCSGTSGRKLIEQPFNGDTTVYTGFAYKGDIPTGDSTVYTGYAYKGWMTHEEDNLNVASIPEEATEVANEPTPEQTSEESADSDVETAISTETAQEATSESTQETAQEATSESTQEATPEAGITNAAETAEPSQEHTELEEKTEENVVKTSRRLLMAN